MRLRCLCVLVALIAGGSKAVDTSEDNFEITDAILFEGQPGALAIRIDGPADSITFSHAQFAPGTTREDLERGGIRIESIGGAR